MAQRQFPVETTQSCPLVIYALHRLFPSDKWIQVREIITGHISIFYRSHVFVLTKVSGWKLISSSHSKRRATALQNIYRGFIEYDSKNIYKIRQPDRSPLFEPYSKEWKSKEKDIQSYDLWWNRNQFEREDELPKHWSETFTWILEILVIWSRDTGVICQTDCWHRTMCCGHSHCGPVSAC